MARSSNDTLSVAETHEIGLRFGNKLIAHSANLGWRNLYASLATETAWAETLYPANHPCLIYCLRGSAQVRRKIAGSVSVTNALLAPGQFAIIPADVELRLDVCGDPDILHVYLRRSMVDRITEEYLGKDPRDVDVIPRLGDTDPLLGQLARSTIAALRGDDATSGYYVDSLAHMITVQLLARHTNNSSARRGGNLYRGATDSRKISQAREYIEAHIDGDLSLSLLAAQIKVSPRYLTRLFRQHLGEPPHRYVLLRRIERARHLLRATDMPIASIALCVGFSSQSHLTSAFQKFVGVPPRSYRRGAEA